MTYYRVYLTGRDGHVLNVRPVEAEDDEAVLKIVTEMDRTGFGAEIWEGARKLPTTFPYQPQKA